MGMNVIGKNPEDKTGEYFRISIWWWRPLWDYCCEVAPEICNDVRGHLNEEDGLDAADSLALAAQLRMEIESGRTAASVLARESTLDALPDEDCHRCKGVKPCDLCHNTGKVRPIQTWSGFSVENVAEFALFLEKSGGFEIW